MWLLTSDYNDYDQHGSYFIALFGSQPSKDQLLKHGVPVERVEHVLAGGGRINNDYCYYTLEEVTPE